MAEKIGERVEPCFTLTLALKKGEIKLLTK